MPSLKACRAAGGAAHARRRPAHAAQTLDAAAAGGRAACRRTTRRWPLAIAGEALRRLPDLDALIDSATQRPLPDDAKARMVLRLALAQKIGLDTPDHALVATALPLVDGGPRRLVHGVLGTLLRRGVPQLDAPRLPDAVEERWREAWGEEVVRPRAAPSPSARRSTSALPTTRLRKPMPKRTAASRSPRATSASPCRRRSPSLPALASGGWWVQDLAASLPARLIPATAQRRARPLRGARRQDHAACRGRACT